MKGADMKDANDSKTKPLFNAASSIADEGGERCYLEHDLVDMGLVAFKAADGFHVYEHGKAVGHFPSSRKMGNFFAEKRIQKTRPGPGPGRGGKRANSGRKALDASGTVITSIRLTGEQRATLDMCGGVAWLRTLLEGIGDGSIQLS